MAAESADSARYFRLHQIHTGLHRGDCDFTRSAFPKRNLLRVFQSRLRYQPGVELEFIHKASDIFTLSANSSFSRARGERSLPADILRGLKTRSEGAIYNDVAFDWDKPWQFVVKANITVPADKKPRVFGVPLPRDCNFNVKFWGRRASATRHIKIQLTNSDTLCTFPKEQLTRRSGHGGTHWTSHSRSISTLRRPH